MLRKSLAFSRSRTDRLQTTALADKTTRIDTDPPVSFPGNVELKRNKSFFWFSRKFRQSVSKRIEFTNAIICSIFICQHLEMFPITKKFHFYNIYR